MYDEGNPLNNEDMRWKITKYADGCFGIKSKRFDESVYVANNYIKDHPQTPRRVTTWTPNNDLGPENSSYYRWMIIPR